MPLLLLVTPTFWVYSTKSTWVLFNNRQVAPIGGPVWIFYQKNQACGLQIEEKKIQMQIQIQTTTYIGMQLLALGVLNPTELGNHVMILYVPRCSQHQMFITH